MQGEQEGQTVVVMELMAEGLGLMAVVEVGIQVFLMVLLLKL